MLFFFFSSRRRHTSCALVTGVQTCALPIYAVFERVGQEATRRLAARVFRHLHQLSLRFHLERRTGAVTRVVERGTKSIDTMLYFMLFNIAPTVFELALVLGIFWVDFGLWQIGRAHV